MVELTALVATRATRSLCSATKLVSAGYSIVMKPDQSALYHSGDGSILLRRCGKRDYLSIRVTKSRENQCHHFHHHESAKSSLSQE